MPFYFQIEEGQIAIVDAELFDKTGCLSDDDEVNERISAALPEGFGELTDAIFECDFDDDEARRRLTESGFIERRLFDI